MNRLVGTCPLLRRILAVTAQGCGAAASAGSRSATVGWSNIAAPVVAGHIHEGQAGVPENPGYTINLFGPSLFGASNPVSGCTIVPRPVIGEMFRFPEFFNIVVHNEQYPAGAIRGELGGGSLKCQLNLCPGP